MKRYHSVGIGVEYDDPEVQELYERRCENIKTCIAKTVLAFEKDFRLLVEEFGKKVPMDKDWEDVVRRESAVAIGEKFGANIK